MSGFSRRTLLAAGAGLAVAACGGSGGSASSAASAYSSLLAFFDPASLRVGRPQRLVFGLGDREGVVTKGGPDALTMTFTGPGGQSLGAAVTATRHGQAIPRPYWAASPTFPTAGTYTARATIGSTTLEQTFTVPASSPVPAPGDHLVAVDTPTPSDPHGVTEVCTRQPACPLHDVTLRQAMSEGRPIAFLIGTPAYCQTGVCGPVLDVVLGEHATFGDRVHFLHAEVYAQPYKDPSTPTSPAVDAYSLTYEPALFLAGADGVIRDRLDVLLDGAELHEALGRLVS